MPKIKDKIYGEMNWEEWDYDYGFWFSNIEDEEFGEFEMLVHSNSLMDFLAVRNTHKTYNSLMINLPIIIDKALEKIFKEGKIFTKRKERRHVKKVFGQHLELVSIKIFSDLNSEITFTATIQGDTDTELAILLDESLNIIDFTFEAI